MINKNLAEKIIALKHSDLEFRSKLVQEGKLGDGYHEEMEKLHVKNAKTLDGIIEEFGFPSIDRVGKEASEAAWLIIQHAISLPGFMKKCKKHLEEAVAEGNANPKHLAYLTDRIALLEGKEQLYGTQFDWNDEGELVPNDYDDLLRVNERRKSVGLKSLQEQTEIIQKQAGKEHPVAPKDVARRKQEYDDWRRKVGWI